MRVTAHISNIGQLAAICPKSGEVTAKVTHGVAEIYTRTQDSDTRIYTHGGTHTELMLGIVRQSNVGEMMLCGSDGVLVTIYGEYLIVRRK